jgi:nucleoside-diphosphate-sugar epimerase
MAVNRDGTRLLAEAVRLRAPKAHFIQISSLAARSPELSGYASSKRAGEDVAFETLGRKSVSVIRPPAVYGPGDRETLIFFQLAQRSRIPLPGRPDARFALVHADDAARTIASVAEYSPSGAVHSFSDDRPTGYSWREILETAAAAVGNSKPRFLPVPAAILKGVGNTLGLVSKLGGPAGMVNAGKIRELLHEDWAVRPDEALRLTERDLRYSLLDGFIDAAVWYRQAGWL